MSDKKPNNKTDENNDLKKRSDKNKKKRKLSIFRVVLVSIIILGFIGAGATAGIVMSIIKDTEPIDGSNIYETLEKSSFMYDSEGQLIEKIESNSYRVIVDYSEMPEHLIDAFVAIEDERFWTHKGIDIKRIIGAAWTNLTTGSRQGASTINQQLAVNLYLDRSDATYTRKIKDAYYGILLNRQLSKEQILEAYMNTIWLGSGAHGVQAASQVYFSKDVEELTIAEAALIAGITKYPTRNTPIVTLNKEDVQDHHVVLDDSDSAYTIVMSENIDKYTIPRQKLVLDAMKRLGYITESEYQDALNEDIKSNLNPNRNINQNISSFFGDLVKKDVIEALVDNGYTEDEATNMLYYGGLRINTTLDTKIQTILDEEYSNSDSFPKISYSDRSKLLSKEGFTEDENGNILDAEGQIQPQSAMVISDPKTGQIKAIVGGRNTSGKRVFNRALSPRQPGSSIKPIAVYAPAIESGFTAGTIVDDVPGYFNSSSPNSPWPRNFYSKFKGLITFREAIERSGNVIAVKVANMLGTNTMIDYMRDMGITTAYSNDDPVTINGNIYSDQNLSTALGGMTRGVSPLEMNAAFNVLANGGTYTKPTTFTEIFDRHGNLILENNITQHRVITEQSAYIVTDMLNGVTSSPRGTGRNANIGRMPVSGKTGTTDDKKDAWFVGYTPYYSASVWIGSDQPVSLTSGSPSAARLFSTVMKRVHEDLEVKNFEMPDGIVRTNICTVSGKRPTEYCYDDPRGSTVRSELFVKGTDPKDYCDVHVKAEVHDPSGKLATDLTPPWQITTKIFIKRPIPYNPEENGGIVPIDYQYELPTEYYDPIEDGLGITFPGGSIDGEDPDKDPTEDDDENNGQNIDSESENEDNDIIDSSDEN